MKIKQLKQNIEKTVLILSLYFTVSQTLTVENFLKSAACDKKKSFKMIKKKA